MVSAGRLQAVAGCKCRSTGEGRGGAWESSGLPSKMSVDFSRAY